MSTVILLGPQQPMPSLGPALRRCGVEGPFTAVTAGWQEREGETGDLERHLDAAVVDLKLYHRAEDVFGRDRLLALAYRERQVRLKELQRLYRVRLGHALAALRELMAATGAPEPLAQARAGALAALRTLDRQHLRDVRKVHAEFDANWPPATRGALAEHVGRLAELVRGSAALLIAGGHVAILVNRLRLFGIDQMLGSRPVVAWSAGAMALADRVVLFHDHPPQGPGDSELLVHGLGLAPGIVPLPHARRRLALDDPARVRRFAARFAPARCLALEPGTLLQVTDGGWQRAERLRALAEDGSLTEVAASCPA
jgi:hypothetical protein